MGVEPELGTHRVVPPSLGGLAVTNPTNRETIRAFSYTSIRGVTWTRDGRRVIFASAG
jgi:hypothetical protein